MGWKDIIEWPGKFLANGGHAQQEIPSQHRLLNAGGMFVGWWALDQLRHVVFGVKMKAEGEYVDVPIEEVPAPLRFLHKTIEWDPHSETSDNQWKKLAYQLFPGVGAGVGAVAGSTFAYNRTGRAQGNKALHLKGIDKLNMLDMDYVAQYSHSLPLRMLSGFFGTFSAASGLTFLYGMFLNPAFASANGAKIFTHSLAKGNAAPHKAAALQIDLLETYLKADKGEAWSKQFVERVIQPLLGHELNTPELQAKAVKTLQGLAGGYLNEFKASKLPDAQKAKAFGSKVAEDLVKKLGLDPKKAIPGNANPAVRWFNDGLAAVGLSKSYMPGSKASSASGMEHALPVIGVGATAAGAVMLAQPYEGRTSDTLPPMTRSAAGSTEGNAENGESAVLGKHATPDAEGKTPEEYVRDAMSMHAAQHQGLTPPSWLKWMGDAQLAVLPTNRMYCAIGLTAGQIIGGNMGNILMGHTIDGKAIDTAKVPTYLQWMKGLVKDYNPKNVHVARNRWISYAQWGIFSVCGLIGVKLGTDYAYKNVKEKNRDPHYLEDYLPRISMHEGKMWSWLAAFSANFGSASGLWTLPIPGLNYGIGLAGRATSMQDRNFMLPGLNKAISGASTTSFLRLREGVNYLCHYAVENPAETPDQLEWLAYTMLGPIFKDKLTTEHIQKFTQAVHEVRDKFWQEGGIPKEKRNEAMKVMREVFTGAGLEVLLIDLGLNPGAVAFEQLNGLTGKIGNIGVSDKIHKEQDNYHKALAGRLEKYVSEKLISQAQADWVNAGIEAIKHGQKAPPLPAEEAIEPAAVVEPAPQKKFTERAPKKADHFHDLLKKSEETGDWRTKAGLSEEHRAPAVMGG